MLRRGRVQDMANVLEKASRRCPAPGTRDHWGWLDRYKWAVRSAHYAEAALIGERLLDLEFDLRFINVLRWPRFDSHFQYHSLPGAYWDFIRKPLLRFVRDQPRSPWGCFFLRWVLPPGRGTSARRRRRAIARRLKGFSLKRYGWMRAESAKDHLIRGEFAQAVTEYRAALKCFPGDWPSLFFMGETLLCQGSASEAAAVFDRALRAAPARDAGEAEAWRGEAYLWVGDYKKALVLLESASRKSARHAAGWRGGALLKLGRLREARAVLKNALRENPNDTEARIWRAEALLRSGKPREVLRELAKADGENGHLYAVFLHALRALAYGAMGSKPAMAREFKALPSPVLRFLRRKRLNEKRDHGQVLESLLEFSRGVRRDGYERAVWMR